MLQRLNPADHFTLVMDQEIRASGLAGNFCGLVLALDGLPNHNYIRQCCESFAKRYPLAIARLGSAGKRYAWFTSSNQQIPFNVYQTNDVTREQHFLDIINRNESITEAPPFSIHLIEEDKKSYLVIRWFHPALDAKGAELLLHHLFGTQQATLPASQEAPIDALLKKWSLWHKCKLLFRGVQNVRNIDRSSSVLPNDIGNQSSTLSFARTRFSSEQSKQIMQQAIKHTGITGIALYFIGCLMRAMELAGSSKNGEAYCVPYAVNLRRNKAMQPIFGNQVSFMFARSSRELVRSRELLFPHLREQNKQEIKLRRDHAMIPLLQAGSWLPLEKLGKIVRKSPSDRERSSFWFSYTGDMDQGLSTINDCQITDMYQLSQVTAPPSLGLLMSRFQGRLSLSYNIAEENISPSWLQRLDSHMKSELLGENPE